MSQSAIYARYSSHNQDGGTSIEVQLEQCRAVAGPSAVEYIDRAVTGTTMIRPAFSRMMNDAAAGLFSTLFVYKFDRFGRDAESHRFVKILEACGVRVISATEGEDPLVRGIQLVVAEDFSRKLSERCRLGKIKSFEQGVWQNGMVPFGYRRDAKVHGIEIEPKEAEAVRFAFDRYTRNDVSLRQVANMLMDQGHRPRKAPYWSGGTMRAFLTLPLYRGVRRHRDVEVFDAALQIVDTDVWQRVHGLITNRKATRIVGKRVQAFTRLLYCGECGSVFSRTSSTYNGKKYPYRWGCEQRLSRGAHICANRHFVPELSLLADITRTFEEVFQEAESIIAEVVSVARQHLKSSTRTAGDLAVKLRAMDADLERLVNLLSAGHITDADAVAAVSERIGNAKRERDRLVAEIAAMPTEDRSLDRIEREARRLFESTRANLGTLEDGSAVNALLHETIGPMTVDLSGNIGPAGSCHISRGQHDSTEQAAQVISKLFWAHWAA